MGYKSRFLRNAILGVLAPIGLAQMASAEDTLNIVFGTYLPPDDSLAEHGIIPWLNKVTETSDGNIATQFIGGGAVVNAKDNLFALKNGLVDATAVTALYFTNELPVSNLFVNMGGGMQNPLAATAALTETFAFNCPACDAEMEKWNVMSLGAWVSPPYDLLCTKEVKNMDDMKGLRVRASGHAVSLSSAIGATTTNFTTSELYEALQRGQVDCSFGSVGWMTTYSLSDSAKFDIDLNAGGVVNPTLIGVRADLWKQISPAQRKILLESAPLGIAGAVFGYIEQEEETLADAKRGITVVTPDADVVSALATQVDADVSKAVELAKSKGVDSAAEIAETFLASYEKWKGKLDGNETREEYAQILSEEIYSRMISE